MSRAVTLAGYAVLAAAAFTLQVSGRVARFGEVVDALARHWPFRLLLLTGWLWLGWHLFARVAWR